MTTRLVGLLSFLSALHLGLVSATIPILTGAEGGDGTMSCHFTSSGSWKFFCKDKCTREGILVKTDSVSAKSGRYSLNYEIAESSGKGIVSVTITNMTGSDAGRYRCGLGQAVAPDTIDFILRVSNVSELLDKNGLKRTNVEGETLRRPCSSKLKPIKAPIKFFFCKGDCEKDEDILIETDQKKAQSGRFGIEYDDRSILGLYVTIEQVKTSDTGRYRCGYGSALTSDSHLTFSIIIIKDPLKPTPRPSPTLAPSSTPAPTSPHAVISSTSGSSTPAALPTKTTEPPAAAAVSTSESTQTLQHFSISSTTASVFSNTPDQSTVLSGILHPDHVVPLVVFMSLVGALLLVLLLLYMWKTVKKHRGNFEVPVLFKTPGLASTCELTSGD